MVEILIRAGGFVAIIVLGYVLRKLGFFGENAFPVLSKVVLRITLPAAVVVSFSNVDLDPALLIATALGLGGCVLLVLLSLLINCRRSREEQAFSLLNTTSYNIGCFVMPFVQSFFGPVGVITTSLFDLGNSVMTQVGALAVAKRRLAGADYSWKNMIGTVFKSVAFDTYLIMAILSLCHLTLPKPIITFAEILAGANAPMAMLMIGVGLRLEISREHWKKILEILGIRLLTAVALAVFCWFVLPLGQEARAALVVLSFSPVASTMMPNTAAIKGDVGLAGAVGSVSVLLSIGIIVGLLLILL